MGQTNTDFFEDLADSFGGLMPGHQKPHPMAFSFRSAAPERVFFQRPMCTIRFFIAKRSLTTYSICRVISGWATTGRRRERVGEETSKYPGPKALLVQKLPYFNKQYQAFTTIKISGFSTLKVFVLHLVVVRHSACKPE